MVRPSTVSVEAAEVEARDAGQIFRQHGARIRRWASRLGGPLVDCDDVVQEVFAVVHRRIAELPPAAALPSWLYKVTQNIATSRRRRERLRRWLGGLSGDYTDAIAATGPSALDNIERREAAVEVYAALDRLDDKYRSTIILFEIEGMSGEEIATLTDTPLATVWIRLHRGREQFRRSYRKALQKRGER